MFTLTEIVKDGILEIRFSDTTSENKIYLIKNIEGNTLMQGKIAGFTQRTCLYVGDLKKGNYEFCLGEVHIQSFSVK